MRILIDGRTIGDKPSGVGMYGYNFAKGLLGTVEKLELYIVTDIAESPQILELQREGAQLVIYGTKVAKNLALRKYFRYVQSIIYEIKPDFFWEINNLFPIKLVNPYGKIMTTVHDVFPYTMPECFGKIYPYYFKYGIRNMLQYTDAILYDSLETKKQLEHFEKAAIDKINMVLYVMLTEKESKTNIESEGQLPFYFYIGNLEKRKGSDVLLKGYEKYRAIGGKKQLRYGGKVREDDIGYMMKQLEEKDIGAHYIGYISSEEKEQYYAEADGFLFPSRAEGFGMPALEALEYNCPVLVSDLSIFDEILGGAVERFEFSDSRDESAQALAEKMIELDAAGKCTLQQKHQDAVAEQLEKYKPEALIPQLIDFMKKLGD